MNILTNIKYFFHNFVDDEDYISLMMTNKYFYKNMRLDEKSMIEKGEYGIFFKKYKKEYDFYLKRFGMKKLLMKYHTMINNFENLKKMMGDMYFELNKIKINIKKLKFSEDFLLNSVNISIYIIKTNKKHTIENSYVGNSMHIHKKYKDKISKDIHFSGLCIDPDDLKETVQYYNFKNKKDTLYFINFKDYNENECNFNEYFFKCKKYQNKNNFIYCNCSDDKILNYCIKIKESIITKNGLSWCDVLDLSYLKIKYNFYINLLKLTNNSRFTINGGHDITMYGFFSKKARYSEDAQFII